MRKAALLLACRARAWRSVRMASSGMARRDPLANKVALVTASTDGIGFAIARRLARDGAHVVVSSRKQQNVDRAVAALQGEGLSVSGTVCHVGKAEDRERLVATAVNLHGGIDILVTNAAVSPFFGNLMDVTEEVWDKILDINVKATALMTKAVVPEMEKRGGGSVVIVASIGAYLPFPLWMDKAREESIKETMQIRRIGKPDDCAGIVSFLCSEDASYITGETVVVGGGTPSRL
ncbi:dehydrogenase/reductase SDR family member 4 isoform X2 [Ursus americanus]|uniref:Dehydrogenase/reductase SDR family member 4 isoform X2 n=1 Tax=Ursus maritimus TaxID=29073 RepID=A0A8M1F4C8_URSMA|nr:dehydrogenase/reductase SDR family member 4 isoform X3 [Ursus arctos]XP_040476697.1 dehydrogenase/reductase SDR family member 4 isoform X2 [Ursus maritimus]XP_045658659.1 dehydrogenase/reductase SDR family member 4 isoform X2 [Ursus americanus]